ncbi:hypothetical protein [Pirellula sp. SH-Sr6A]|uniref:hypothetical protein n=1 Tax=Pirellula sp. SH-Sr6A TaxID=1632865 RepID=UPI00143C882B|nr:hypothetical protein [Pirellula sp. SH-Sr6A]
MIAFQLHNPEPWLGSRDRGPKQFDGEVTSKSLREIEPTEVDVSEGLFFQVLRIQQTR